MNEVIMYQDEILYACQVQTLSVYMSLKTSSQIKAALHLWMETNVEYEITSSLMNERRQILILCWTRFQIKA